MLKRLELVGFKSFADKTVFEFAGGVTAIVGPNGSGKSNIVDAVRWILGEQSAKSLRGGEMADVIFNGSSSRRSLGLAEVTMTFDNRRRQLPLDAEEVEITRRVYRTGEGEYLLNGQVCRLKDQRDLFLGSGLGNDDGCIIAQGKVDVLLQASPLDRRTIIEEAAGISRFKARKLETLRKLERVDQNLARVKDIVDEVEKQLRSVKLQAAKAQRFHEYSTRLKELRLELGLREHHASEEKLARAQETLDSLRQELDQRAARAVACEAEAERLEFFLADLEDALREQEAQLAQMMQLIKTQETTLTHERSSAADLEAELLATRQRLASLAGQVRELAAAAAQAADELEAAEAQALAQRQELHALEAELRATESQFAQVQQQAAQDKSDHLEMMRRAAHLQNEAVAGKAQVDNLRRESERLRLRSSHAAETLASVDLELQELVAADQRLAERLAAVRQELAGERGRRDEERQRRDRLRETLSQRRQERSGLASRIEVLQGMLRSHEGLSIGVREVFRLLEEPEPGPWKTVLGMIGDFLTVKRDYAHLIDLALGDWAQRFVVRDVEELRQALAAKAEPFAGRVSFLPLARTVGETALADLKANRLVQLSLLSHVREADGADVAPEHPGLVAPAEQVVSCDHPELTDLPAQLLGRTLIVHDLAAAQTIAAYAPGFRLVTLDGELLEPDGTLTVGRHHADAGILARKSELDDLQAQLARLETAIAEMEAELARSGDDLDRFERNLHEREEEAAVAAEQAADLRGRVERHRDRRQGLHEEVTVSTGELSKIDDDIARLETSWQSAQEQAAHAEAEVQTLLGRVRQADDALRDLDRQRHDQQQICTKSQVQLATMEERLSALRGRHQQLSRDAEQRAREQASGTQIIAASQKRLVDSQLAMLHASARLAQAFLDKERLQGQIQEMVRQRESRRGDRARLTQQAQTVRQEWRTQQELFHQRELDVNNLRHTGAALIEKLRDDYQVELTELYAQKRDQLIKGEMPFDAPAAETEVADLRKKLAKLGNVNMEALAELQELETRAVDLQKQYDDLVQAKKSLEEIIAKINLDSRRLFLETFNAVRVHFQELFRKVFGGGMADLVLEDECDVLECGLEIIARPPGKELRSISLMSGGEKTLTAVALLLAVFRSKPAPFCLLDEVDAALDEANISRFTAVLREFTDLSQFILVTHSKKTMATADVLYGITMQESGISKQVAVRFEDWVDPNEEAESRGKQEVA
jgi:chromosome segregation protein